MSMRCCLPVKNGWQFEHTSTCSSGLVEPVVNVLPQAQVTFAWTYLGWILSFIAVPLCSLNRRDDGNLPPVAAGRSVTDLACHEGEKGVVLADADVVAGQHARAALAHEHRAGLDDRPAELFHAQTLAGRIAAVAGRTRALLVCH